MGDAFDADGTQFAMSVEDDVVPSPPIAPLFGALPRADALSRRERRVPDVAPLPLPWEQEFTPASGPQSLHESEEKVKPVGLLVQHIFRGYWAMWGACAAAILAALRLVYAIDLCGATLAK